MYSIEKWGMVVCDELVTFLQQWTCLLAGVSWNHRIPWGRFVLGGTINGPLVKPFCNEQGHLPLDQAAQSPIRPGLECPRDGTSTTSLRNLCFTLLGAPDPTVHVIGENTNQYILTHFSRGGNSVSRFKLGEHLNVSLT